MNLVAITAALSSFNSGIYGTARMAYNLAQQNNAPRSLLTLTKAGIPLQAILFSSSCIALTVALNYWYPKQIFNLLLAIATIAAIINWLTILITHAYFKRKTQVKTVFPAIFYPLSSIIAALFLISVAITMYFMADFKLAIIIAPLWLSMLSLGYWIKTKFMKSRHGIKS
jgi:L-asparagine transporter-like permease